MRYLPLTDNERKQILEICGVQSFDELVSTVPKNLHLQDLLKTGSALCEDDLLRHFRELANKVSAAGMTSFLGQGAYDHTWPVVIDQIINRGEFLTAYTPYQPEISQGTLQMVFEFQSMIAGLMDMEVSNASLYDGGSAVLEAVLMAARLKNAKSGTVYVSEGTYNGTRDILETYLGPLNFTVKTWAADGETFRSSASALFEKHDDAPVAVVMQSPNKWGLVEDWNELKKAGELLQSKSVAFVSHPHALALFATPGASDIDIVASEGQTLGIPVGFGGPYLGLLCCKKTDVRQMPGRLVGATVDSRNQTAFCVTLATREQHIRREKATSNICSNQNLMALRAAIYMSLMGPEGLRRVAQISRDLAYYAHAQLVEKGFTVLAGEFFNEISLLVSREAGDGWWNARRVAAEKTGVLAGLSVPSPAAAKCAHVVTLAFTERHRREDVDRLVSLFGDLSNRGAA